MLVLIESHGNTKAKNIKRIFQCIGYIKNGFISMKKSALNKANNLIKTGEFLKAEIKLKKILAKRAENEGALHGLSLIALHYSKYDEAAYFCAKAISLNPKFSEALNTMGNIYYKQKALDKA
ncbi:MAG: tetratricopeptide (TPR) repeat protein, partial [Alteromonadaceae bacterium]